MTAAMTASVERTSVVEPHLRILHTVAQAVSGSLDVDEVLRTALDALTHVTGHEMSSLHLLSEDGQQLHLQGERLLSPMLRDVNVLLPVGKGQLGGVAKTGESYYINQDVEGGAVTLDKPLAAVPLKIKEHVIGLIVIYKLLQQKDSFSAVDYELFSLLAAHAATAIFSSKLYSQSERKLNTIQSFLDLLTTTSS